MTEASTNSPHSPAVSISDLPAELLSIIFKFLYMESPFSEHGRAHEDLVWTETEDILSPALFPYAPASVSKLWRNILSTFPQFWTRVVIFTDSPSLSYSRSQLEWSRELLINVIVITHPSLPETFWSSHTEQARVREIIDLVTPHVRRCKTLRYDVTYTSSLPRIATDFRYSAPHLRKLTLDAFLEKGLPGFLDGTQAAPFLFPMMKDLRIDGWNFVDLFENSMGWFESLLEVLPKSLAISHYRPTNMEDRFSLHKAYPLLNQFTTLMLEDVHFDCSSSAAMTAFDDIPNHAFLELCDLSGRLTAKVLDQRSAEVLSIVRCPLTAVTSLPMSMSELSLEGIDDPDLSADLRDILPTWDGFELHVKNCPGFDDSVLDILSKTHFTATGQEFLNAPLLQSLSIKNCQGFSIPALRLMTEKRMAYIARADDEVEDFNYLDEFTVSVEHVPPLEKEDRRWFKRLFGEASLSCHDEELWQRTGIRPED